MRRCSPNIFTRPSEASRKEHVSTPSFVNGTSANDYPTIEVVNVELERKTEGPFTFTVSKYGAIQEDVELETMLSKTLRGYEGGMIHDMSMPHE